MKRSRGSGFLLDPTEKSGAMAFGRSDHIADAALFLGCSFRVGWGPNGVFYHSSTPVGPGGTKNGLSSCIQVERVALDRTVRDDGGVVKDELVEMQFVSPLSLHMSMSRVMLCIVCIQIGRRVARRQGLEMLRWCRAQCDIS